MGFADSKFGKFLAGGGGSLIGAGVSLIGGLIGAGKARRQARAMAKQAKDLNDRIENFNRQDIINPYADVKDLSSMVTNPFENLQVATEAAEMKAREQDLSLATTLDTLRATGAGAGGATALAQAASRSKANIAASIEQQEAQNARLRAQGEQQMQQLQMREAARVQQAQAQGKAFEFGARERRETAELNRLAAQQQNLMGQANQLRGQASAMTGQALGSIGSLLGAAGGMAAYQNYLNNNSNINIIDGAGTTIGSSPAYGTHTPDAFFSNLGKTMYDAQQNARARSAAMKRAPFLYNNTFSNIGLNRNVGSFGQSYSGAFGGYGIN